jgi:Cu/Ag efflux protein CusF
MKNYKVVVILVIVIGLSLAACTGKTSSIMPAAITSTPESCATPAGGAAGTCKNPTAIRSLAITPSTVAPQLNLNSTGVVKTDSQGTVTLDVKPINLDNPGDTLVFDVSLNTHMVDLSMDLATLANLTTDNGLTIQATQWDAPKGGHHVEGKLNFPISSDGKSLLKSSKELTLTIKNLDAPTRIFTWQLAK